MILEIKLLFIKPGFVKTIMQIVYTIYYVNHYFFVTYTLQDFKCIDNIDCLEANLTRNDFNRDIFNK